MNSTCFPSWRPAQPAFGRISCCLPGCSKLHVDNLAKASREIFFPKTLQFRFSKGGGERGLPRGRVPPPCEELCVRTGDWVGKQDGLWTAGWLRGGSEDGLWTVGKRGRSFPTFSRSSAIRQALMWKHPEPKLCCKAESLIHASAEQTSDLITQRASFHY